MTVTSANSNSGAYAYLQSLLQAGGNASASNSDPLSALMNSFYPNSPTGDASATPPPPPPLANGPMISPDSMSALISTQESGSRGLRAEMLFAKMDTDGNGSVSKTEFENVFGAGADMSKVDGLFNALDTNRDGSVGNDEFMSAVQDSQGHHRHAHRSGGGDPLQQLLAGTGVDGATTQTTTAADGSTTTTIKYADGSSVSTTTPAPSAAGSQTSTSGNGNAAAINALEQLIKNQAQFLSKLAAPASSLLATV